MRQITLACAAVLAVAACGGSPPDRPAQTEAPDSGAGSVLRVDAALDALVPDDYSIEKLHGDFVFTEGPVWVRRGDPHLLFSDLGGNAIHKWSTDGLSTFM